jgi:DNA gyrase/topoisomerase IV subunit B
VRYLARGRRLIVAPIRATGASDGIRVDAAIAWAEDELDARIEGFANEIACGGPYLTAFRTGIRRAVGRLLGGRVRRAADIARGLVAVVHVRLADPQFTSWRKGVLANPEVGTVVRRVVAAGIGAAAGRHPTLDALLDRLA